MTPDRFEADVRQLLELQGWSIQSEKVLLHKKVDAYAEKRDDFGRIQRLAVECKCWTSKISQLDITAIYTNYYPLIENNLIDLVLVVSNVGLAPSAQTFVESTRGLRHRTYSDILNNIIDFRVNNAGIVMMYKGDAVSRYYVPQSFIEGDGALEEYILNWIDKAETNPIAVLGGYGLGKTTLVKRLACILAERCIEDASARIPIILPLSSIATDQTLEGLLGRHFTATNVCNNYNYHLFKALNERGRFVIFLDGFDEMKKTISWETLLFNLEQLHLLICQNAKVVLLGRPSAFLTDDEHAEALHGIKRHLGARRAVPGWPDYEEVNLRPFSRQQVSIFIKKYLSTMPENDEKTSESRRKISMYLNDIESPQGKRLLDLAARPVQLSMLMQLLPEFTGDLDSLTVAMLYTEFIDFLLRREQSKAVRHAFRHDERKEFASRLAYWMWQDNQRSSIDIDCIPDSIFISIMKASLDVNIKDIKRDLLIAGFLDRRPPNLFYFPHRSFQEFLVAEELVALARAGDSRLNECSYITPEVTSFFLEIAGKSMILNLRKRWESPARPTEGLKQLINTGCAYFGLRLLSEERFEDTEENNKTVHDDERMALLRKLEISGVIKTKNVAVSNIKNDDKEKEKARNLHRSRGVTAKKKYNK